MDSLHFTHSATMNRLIILPLLNACWVFSCFRNAPNSDMHYRIFHVHTWSFLCMRIHGGWAHRRRVSTAFLTQKNSQIFLVFLMGFEHQSIPKYTAKATNESHNYVLCIQWETAFSCQTHSAQQCASEAYRTCTHSSSTQHRETAHMPWHHTTLRQAAREYVFFLLVSTWKQHHMGKVAASIFFFNLPCSVLSQPETVIFFLKSRTSFRSSTL